MTTAHRSRATEWAVLTLVLVWGLYQAFWNILNANVSADEPIYAAAGWAYLHGDTTMNLEHPPVAKYVFGGAQLLLGEGLPAARIAAAIASVITGLVLYLWLRREVGWIGAVAAAGFWWVLPHGSTTGVRIDRFALLEPFMVLFAVIAFAAAWQWRRSSIRAPGAGRPSTWATWLWLAVAGISMGLAIASKVSIAVTVPALALAIIVGVPWRRALVGLVSTGVLVGAVFVLAYLPVGFPGAIEYMLAFQSVHDGEGHLITVAGTAYQFPPWWTNLLFTVEGVGPAAAVVLAAGTVASLWSRRWALLLVLATALGGLLVFYLLVSNVALNHYYYAWDWLLCAFAGVGISALFAGGRHRVPTWVRRAIGVVLLTVAMISGAAASVAIWQLRPAGMELVIDRLDALGVGGGDILVAGMAEWEYTYQLDEREVTDPADPDIVAYATKDEVRFPLDPAWLAALERRSGALDRYIIDDVTLYVVRSAER